MSERVGCIALPLAGLLLCAFYAYFILWKPARTALAARHWTAVPCQITFSDVVQRTGVGTRTVYKLDIRYRYTFGGQTYTSNRYDPVNDDGSGGYATKRSIADRYPAGTMATCYVNPADPTVALLSRGLPARMWWGALAVVGIVVCLAGLSFGVALEVFERQGPSP